MTTDKNALWLDSRDDVPWKRTKTKRNKHKERSEWKREREQQERNKKRKEERNTKDRNIERTEEINNATNTKQEERKKAECVHCSAWGACTSRMTFFFKRLQSPHPLFRKSSALKRYGAEAILPHSAQQLFLQDAHCMPCEDSYSLSLSPPLIKANLLLDHRLSRRVKRL